MRTSALVLPVLAAALASACGGAAKSDPAAEKPKGVPVRTAKVERRQLADTLLLTGTLRPQAQVEVVAEVNARLMRVLKDEGNRVQKGDVLAVLDETDYRLSHDRAKAALAVAEANKAHAVVERDRANSLLKTGGITDKEHLSAQVGLQVSEAALAQARAEVRAPFSGRVAKRHSDAGTMLTAGSPLFTLVDDARLEFRASVPSGDYGKVKVGDAVDVSVDALGDRPVKGTVARVTPLIEERTRSFEVVVQIPGGDRLVGGLFARATVRVGQVADALVVPPGALVRDGSDPSSAETFVVTAGKADRKKVSVGVETADAVQVTNGLAEGQLVVLDPPVALGSGAPVEVQK